MSGAHPAHERLDGIATAAADEHHCPTLAWGLVVDGQVVTSGAVGVDGDGRPADQHTVFRIASMTKSFTSAAVLALRDEGVWSLDDPIARHAPELAVVQGPAGSPPITLRHLLSMTAGMATDDPWADRHLDFTIDEIDEVYRAGVLFAHRTNDAFQYSNLGFGMIGRCVLRATGRSVRDHVNEWFLQPLGMADTTWVEPDHRRWATPHRWQNDANVPDLPHPLGDGEIAPMGGIWTTVHDLATWIGWLDAANTTPHQPDFVGLSPASRREMQRMQTYAGQRPLDGVRVPTGYGFGLVVRDDPTVGKVVDHSGGLPGYGTNMRWLAGTGIGAIALANTTYAPMAEVTMRMLYAVHEAGLVSRPAAVPSPELSRRAAELVALLNDWDHHTAASLFADNVPLDESFERRAAAARALVERHGPLRVVAVHPTSWANGEVEVQGTGDPFRVMVQMAPLAGGPIQLYTLPGE
ncbi:MAG: Penicillin-binding protein [Actinomycetota bacterium]